MWPFGSKPTLTVQQKLAAVEQDIAAAQAALECVSLAAALSDDPDAGREETAKLDALRQRRQLLKAAIKQAEIAEQQDRDAQAAKDFQTRKRALSQHIGRAERAVAEVSKAQADLAEARRKLVDACQSIVGVLPLGMKTPALPFDDMLSPAALHSLMEVEAHRISPEDTPRPARTREFENPADGSLRTLSANLGAVLSSVRLHFDQRAPIPQAPPSPVATPLPAMSSAPVAPVSSQPGAAGCSEPAGERQSPGEPAGVIDLREAVDA